MDIERRILSRRSKLRRDFEIAPFLHRNSRTAIFTRNFMFADRLHTMVVDLVTGLPLLRPIA